ncbi:hypothetical protein AMTRI_Chr13g92040 [Amborella trichopoda]
MLPKLIFFSAVTAATVAVILLALISTGVKRNPGERNTYYPPISLYIQRPQPFEPPPGSRGDGGALVFHHIVTVRLENTSKVAGKAQGFIIPADRFANSVFNIIFLSLETPDYAGGLSIQAKDMKHTNKEELQVIGGTGSFAFARGLAVFRRAADPFRQGHGAMYQLTLHLRFPDRKPKE